nr:alpha-D-ribose 1-methylphosphonate 5-phosphate C-P-lyase PhnJ [Chromobacterium haemolyticum]
MNTAAPWAYNFGFLDENTKRMLRRAQLKAVAVPGCQVPFGGREMPLPYGWGTGGIQVTASVIGRDDVLKVIDQAPMTPRTRSTSAASSPASPAWPPPPAPPRPA